MRKVLLSAMLAVAVAVPASAHAQANEELAAVQAVITALANSIHTNALTYAAGAPFLGVVATTACGIPARHAGRGDPMRALRTE